MSNWLKGLLLFLAADVAYMLTPSPFRYIFLVPCLIAGVLIGRDLGRR